jgi:hypothetical protein
LWSPVPRPIRRTLPLPVARKVDSSKPNQVTSDDSVLEAVPVPVPVSVMSPSTVETVCAAVEPVRETPRPETPPVPVREMRPLPLARRLLSTTCTPMLLVSVVPPVPVIVIEPVPESKVELVRRMPR